MKIETRKNKNSHFGWNSVSKLTVSLLLAFLGHGGCVQQVNNPITRGLAEEQEPLSYDSDLTANVLSYSIIGGSANLYGVNFIYDAIINNFDSIRLSCSRGGGVEILMDDAPTDPPLNGKIDLSGNSSIYNFSPGASYKCWLILHATDGTLVKSTKSTSFTMPGTLAGAWANVELVQAFGAAPSMKSANQVSTAQVTIKWVPFNPFPGRKSPFTSGAQDLADDCQGLPSDTANCFRVLRVIHGEALNYQTTDGCLPDTVGSCVVTCDSGWGFRKGSASYAAPLDCTDIQVAYPNKYDYVISLVRNGMVEEYPQDPTTGDKNFRTMVAVPPPNMVLVHRESVNYEMCRVLGKTPDPANLNRCVYSRSGAIPFNVRDGETPLDQLAQEYSAAGGFFDMGYSFFIDRWEEGCAYSPNAGIVTNAAQGSLATLSAEAFPDVLASPSTTPLLVQATSSTPLYGFGPPPSSGVLAGQVYYRIGTHQCLTLKNVSGTPTWVKLDSASLNSSTEAGRLEIRRMISNAPHRPATLPGGSLSKDKQWMKPPISGVKRDAAQRACQSIADPVYGQARLPRRREFNVASVMAWMQDGGEPGSRSINERAQLQSGADLNSASTGIKNGCNSNATRSGLLLTATNTLGQPSPLPVPLPSTYVTDIAFNRSEFADGPNVGTNVTAVAPPYLPNAPAASPVVGTTSYLSAVNSGFMVIGSDMTRACVSRFGAQDMFGNASEWVSDEFLPFHRQYGYRGTCDSSGTPMPYANCVYPGMLYDNSARPNWGEFGPSAGSSIDQGARDFGTWAFDGKTGPATFRMDPEANTQGPFLNELYYSTFSNGHYYYGSDVMSEAIQHNADWSALAYPIRTTQVPPSNFTPASAFGVSGLMSTCSGNGVSPDGSYHMMSYGLNGRFQFDPTSHFASSSPVYAGGALAMMWGMAISWPCGYSGDPACPAGVFQNPPAFPTGTPSTFQTAYVASFTTQNNWANSFQCAGYDPAQPSDMGQTPPAMINPNFAALKVYGSGTGASGINNVNSLEGHGSSIGLIYPVVGTNTYTWHGAETAYATNYAGISGYQSVCTETGYGGNGNLSPSGVCYQTNRFQPGRFNAVMGLPVMDNDYGSNSTEQTFYDIAHVAPLVTSGSYAQARVFQNDTQIFMIGSSNPSSGGSIVNRTHGMIMGGSAHSLGVYRPGNLNWFRNVDVPGLPFDSSSTYNSTRTSIGYSSRFTLPTSVNGDYATLILPADMVPVVADTMGTTNPSNTNTASGPAGISVHTSPGSVMRADYMDPAASDVGFRCVLPISNDDES